jgi:SAM-dependent methyltransferase
LIEFAAGDALQHKLRRYPFLAYRSADISRRNVDELVDLTAMDGYAAGSLDILLCSHVLEHIPDDRKAMREICRVLKPDGFAIILVPLVTGVEETHEDPGINTQALRWKYFGMGDHVRQYGKRDFIDRLTAAGLKVDHWGSSTSARRRSVARASPRIPCSMWRTRAGQRIRNQQAPPTSVADLLSTSGRCSVSWRTG